MRALLINFLPLNLTTHASTYTALLAVGTWTDEILYLEKSMATSYTPSVS
jgi:hypothetical protein